MKQGHYPPLHLFGDPRRLVWPLGGLSSVQALQKNFLSALRGGPARFKEFFARACKMRSTGKENALRRASKRKEMILEALINSFAFGPDLILQALK